MTGQENRQQATGARTLAQQPPYKYEPEDWAPSHDPISGCGWHLWVSVVEHLGSDLSFQGDWRENAIGRTGLPRQEW